MTTIEDAPCRRLVESVLRRRLVRRLDGRLAEHGSVIPALEAAEFLDSLSPADARYLASLMLETWAAPCPSTPSHGQIAGD